MKYLTDSDFSYLLCYVRMTSKEKQNLNFDLKNRLTTLAGKELFEEINSDPVSKSTELKRLLFIAQL